MGEKLEQFERLIRLHQKNTNKTITQKVHNTLIHSKIKIELALILVKAYDQLTKEEIKEAIKEEEKQQ